MEVMCGTIRASDRAPRGLRIVMAWPEAAEDQERRKTMKRILIIEDDKEIAGIEEDYLHLAGFPSIWPMKDTKACAWRSPAIMT